MRLPGRWAVGRTDLGMPPTRSSGPRSPPQSISRLAGTNVVATVAGSGTRAYRPRTDARPPPWCRCPGLPPSCRPESSHMLSPHRCRPGRLRNRRSHRPAENRWAPGRSDTTPSPDPFSPPIFATRGGVPMTSHRAPPRRDALQGRVGAMHHGRRFRPRDISPAAVTAGDTQKMSERLTSRTVAPARPPREPPPRPPARQWHRTRSARCTWH